MNPIILSIVSFLIGGSLVYYSIPIIVRMSVLKRLYDEPNERKMNKTVVPNLGGVALFSGISLSSLLSIYQYIFPEFRYIMAGMIIMFFIGIKDDILVISARKKLMAQILCALIITVPGNIRFTDLHGILGVHEINYVVSIVLSSLFIISMINAFNLIDGIDGLASAIGIVASISFGSLFFVCKDYPNAILCASILGSLVAFFIFNVFGKKNKIFMGDTGSLLLGFLFSVLLIKYNEIALTKSEFTRSLSPVLSLAIFIVPLFDMFRLIINRIIEKKSPFAADMNHIHHKILKLGFSHLTTTTFIIFANLIVIAVSFSMGDLNINVQLFSLFVITLAFSLLPQFCYEFRKAKNSNAKKLQLKKLFWPLNLF